MLESTADEEKSQMSNEQKRYSFKEIKILIDIVLLAVQMNISMLSVQDINE